MIKNYLGNLFKTYQRGDAREETYYEHLADFLRDYSQSKRKKKIDVTILPKKTIRKSYKATSKIEGAWFDYKIIQNF